MRRHIFLATLLLFASAISGCQPENRSGLSSSRSPQPTPERGPAFVTPQLTPSLTNAIQIVEPQQLTAADVRMQNWQLNQIYVDGDVLVGTFGTAEQVKPIAVNLVSGAVTGLDTALIVDKQWLASERYFAYIQEDSQNGSYASKLRVHDLLTGKELQIEGYGGNQCCATVAGNRVVWSQVSGGQGWDVYAYDISAGQLISVAVRPLSQMYSKIDGDWIVYLQNEGGSTENHLQQLYAHHIPTHADFFLGTSPYASQTQGGTYGIAHNRVVWVGWTPGEFEKQVPPALHVFDLQTRADRVVNTSSTCVPVEFYMAGDLIAYWCKDFYGYDLAQDALFTIPYPHGIGNIYLSEKNVVFQMQVEEPKIYLTPGAPTATPGPVVAQPAQFQLFVAPINRR